MVPKLIILGGGGWFAAHGRQTACALLRGGQSAVMIDAGSGVGRLIEQPDILAGVQQLDIVLTHFHLDHVVGLACLPAAGLDAAVTVWGPGELLYGTNTRVLLDELLHEPYHPVSLAKAGVAVRDLPGREFELAGISVTARAQKLHSVPTLGLRFGELLAWITDTAYDAESAGFARGCQTIAHEAWFTRDAPQSPEVHSSAAEAAEVAAAAGAEELLLIHLPPFAAEISPLALEALQRFPNVRLAEDGTEVALRAAAVESA